MSESERWFVEVDGYDSLVKMETAIDGQHFVADCGAGDLAALHANRIVADHNGCIDIKESESTVPELVAVCKFARDLYDYLALGPFGAAAKYGPDHDYEQISDAECLRTRQMLETVLAKTGKPAASSSDSACT